MVLLKSSPRSIKWSQPWAPTLRGASKRFLDILNPAEAKRTPIAASGIWSFRHLRHGSSGSGHLTAGWPRYFPGLSARSGFPLNLCAGFRMRPHVWGTTPSASTHRSLYPRRRPWWPWRSGLVTGSPPNDISFLIRPHALIWPPGVHEWLVSGTASTPVLFHAPGFEDGTGDQASSLRFLIPRGTTEYLVREQRIHWLVDCVVDNKASGLCSVYNALCSDVPSLHRQTLILNINWDKSFYFDNISAFCTVSVFTELGRASNLQ